MKKITLCFVCYLLCQISRAQNVGINTNTPSHRFDVNGHINVSTDSSYKIGGFYFVKAKLASNNTWFGKLAGMNSSGSQNLYVGDSSGTGNTGSGSVFIGQSAGRNSISNNSVIIGRSAAPSIIIGDDNVYLGNGAAFLSQYGSSNVIIGKNAGYNNMGSTNVYIGYIAGYKNQNGYGNVGLGYAAGYENINGIENTNIGMQSAVSNTNGNYNTYLGFKSGWGQTSGDYNVMLGYQSGVSINTVSTKNVLIGAFSKTLNIGVVQRSVAIGYKSYISSSDAVAIGGDSTVAVCIACGDPVAALDIDLPIRLRSDNYHEGSDHPLAFPGTDLVIVTPNKPVITITQLNYSDERYLYVGTGHQGQEIVIYSARGIVRIKDVGQQIAANPATSSPIDLRSASTIDLIAGHAIKLIYMDGTWREL
jgi:hypothetical protein